MNLQAPERVKDPRTGLDVECKHESMLMSMWGKENLLPHIGYEDIDGHRCRLGTKTGSFVVHPPYELGILIEYLRRE